ncbi:MAG: recombinase family protein [Anaerolineae bacterium]|jgi:site-specific DNA recombinase|nr:recombinase family protein [Anaerolineae bacterium]
MSKRAVIYARVSTDMQRDNFSIPSQIAECLLYAKKRRYTILGKQYVKATDGKDTSGKDTDAIPAYVDDYTSREISRPSLNAALAYLEAYGFDVLIVHALDRLARDPYIRQTLEREFNSHGARVEYVLGDYDETPEGEVRKDLDATFAKWENTKRAERSIRGKRRKAHSGKWVHAEPPYGYRLNPESDDGLEIAKSQADVIRKIFYLYTEKNYSISQLQKALRESGAVQKKGGTTWASSTINHILDNTTYDGYCYFNRTTRIGRKNVVKDKKEWIRIEVTPILEPGVFEKALKRKKENQQTRRKQAKHEYLLNRLVFCSECGRSYHALSYINRRKGNAYPGQGYRHRKKVGHCMNKQVFGKWLDKIVWDKVKAILLDPIALVTGYEQSVEQQKQALARKIAQVETLEQNLIKIRQQRQNLTTAYLDPDIQMTKTDYLAQKTRIDKDEKAIDKDLAVLHQDLASIPEPADLELLQKFSAGIAEGLLPDAKLSKSQKREILDLMNIKVILYPDETVQLTGWLDASEIRGVIDPGMSVPGKPRVVSTSTSTTTPSRPTTAQEKTRDNMG